MKRAVLIAFKPYIKQDVKQVLPLCNYQLVASTDKGIEGLRLVHRFQPDLVIMDWDIQGIQPLDLLENLVFQQICPIVVILTPEQHDVLSSVVSSDAHHVMFYPLRAMDLIAAIELAEHRFLHQREARKKYLDLEEELKTRKLIYQAVIILVEEGMNEQTAYAMLRGQAMATRKTIRSVALDVIKGLWRPSK